MLLFMFPGEGQGPDIQPILPAKRMLAYTSMRAGRGDRNDQFTGMVASRTVLPMLDTIGATMAR